MPGSVNSVHFLIALTRILHHPAELVVILLIDSDIHSNGTSPLIYEQCLQYLSR